ncbi:MAG: metal ABC transporter substrate-binding protein [Fuerstiella sp.]
MKYTIVFVPLLLLFSGCGQPADPSDSESPGDERSATPVSVVVTSYPLFAMAQEIAGNALTVHYPIPDTVTSPAWKLTTVDISLLQNADAVVMNGAGYEPWANRISLPRSRVVRTSVGFEDQLQYAAGAVTHQHGPSGAASGGTVIPITWLDPTLAEAQLRQVEQVLCRLAPEKAAEISERTTVLADSLQQLSDDIEQLRVRTSADKMTVLCDRTDYAYLLARLNWQCRLLPDLSDTVAGPAGGERAGGSPAGAEPATGEPAADTERRATIPAPSPENEDVRICLLASTDGRPDPKAAAVRPGLTIVYLDLCEQEEPGRTLIDRLQANLTRLDQAIATP